MENFKPDRNLKGWTIYSKDDGFDTSKLKRKGVVDRSEVIKKLKKKPTKSYSYDVCANLLKKTIPKALERDQEEVQAICRRSLNIEKYVFMAMYRKDYQEKELLKFRGKMNEIFGR